MPEKLEYKPTIIGCTADAAAIAREMKRRLFRRREIDDDKLHKGDEGER